VRIEERSRDGVIVLDLHGKFAAGDSSIKDAIESLTARGVRQIVLNFSDVPYTDSVGLSILVRARLTVNQHGGELKLTGVPRYLAGLLHVTRLSTVLECFDDEAAAIQSFGSAL
jgi:anti-sigma B factor antagonist